MKIKRAFQVKAQGMVEFALILPLLLLVMFAIIEFGRLLFIYSGVFTASRDAARYGAAAGDIGGYVAHYQDCAGMRAAARRIGNLVGITTITIQYDDFAPTVPAGTPNTCPSSGTGPAAYGLGDRVRVTVNAPYTPILPLVNLPPGGFQISSTAVRTILKDINIQGTPSAPIGSMLVFFASPASSVDEGDVTVDVRVSIQAPYAENVFVDVQLDGSSTATQGFADDFEFTPIQVLIIAGHTYVDVPVTIHEDNIYEGDETIVLTLANPVNAALGAVTTHTLTIRDDEPPPFVSFTSDAQTMDEAGGSTRITVALSDAAGNPVISGIDTIVPFSVISGTATLGSDFTFNTPSPVTIPAGDLSTDINLTVVDDLLDEGGPSDPPEVAVIELGPPTNAVLGSPSQHALSIVDNDDPPVVSFATAAQQGMEGVNVRVQVRLSAPSGRPISVPFTYTSTATEGAGYDYTIQASPLTIPVGASTADLMVQLLRDSPSEDPPDALNETITITLLDDPSPPPDNRYTLGAPSVTILTIIPNTPPTLSFTSAGQTVGEGAGTVTVGLQLNAAYDQNVSAQISLSGLAASPADYSLITPLPVTIPAGSLSASLTLNLADDTMDELDEDIVLALGALTNAIPGSPSAHTVTILDDDPMPSVYFESTSSSGNEGATLPVNVRLSAASGKNITVFYSAGGTATQGSDYSLSPAGSLTIPVGATQGVINVNLIDDDSNPLYVGESAETVVLTLTTASEATISAPNGHTATILAWVCPTANGFAYASGSNRLLVWNFSYAGTPTLRLAQVTITWPPGTSNPYTDMLSITFGGPIWSGSDRSGSLVVNPTWSGTFATQQMIFQLSRHPSGGSTSVSATFNHCLPYSASVQN